MKSRLAALSGLLLAACASGGETRPAPAPGAGADGAPLVGALENAALPSGACGMILWTLDADRPIAILHVTAGKGAEMALDGGLRKLTLMEQDGASAFGVFEEQVFAFGDVKATVKVRFGLGFDGGSYLERGLVSLERPDGWKTVIPAAGIAGCRGK